WPSLRAPLTATGPGHVSWAVAVPGLRVAVHWPESVLMVMAAGAVRAGAWVSVTVTVWVQVAWPAASVAVQVIVVVPTGYWSVSALPSLRTPVAGTVAPGQATLAVAVALT